MENSHGNKMRIKEMARLGEKLPKGTMLIDDGELVRIAKGEIDQANGINPEADDKRPYWCHAWESIHDYIVLPSTVDKIKDRVKK